MTVLFPAIRGIAVMSSERRSSAAAASVAAISDDMVRFCTRSVRESSGIVPPILPRLVRTPAMDRYTPTR